MGRTLLIGALALLLQACVTYTPLSETRTDLHRTALEGDPAGVEAMLADGADIKATDKRGQRAIHMAADAPQNSGRIIDLLIDHGADPNAGDLGGNTPLHLATSAEAAETLLAAGASVDVRNDTGSTPLHSAHAPGSLRVLLENGASVDVVNDFGESPIHTATGRWIRYYDKNNAWSTFDVRADMEPQAANQMVVMLLEHGAEADRRNPRNGSTPLHTAKGAPVVNTLVEAGADINARDQYGNTPLHIAQVNPAVVRAMLGRGADADAVNDAGRTPAAVVRGYKQNADRTQARIDQAGGQRTVCNQECQSVFGEVLALLGEAETGTQTAGSGSGSSAAGSGSSERLSHLVIEGTSGEYMSPWTSDGVLAEWVDKAINASMGAAAGSAVGAYAGREAAEQVPIIGGLLGSMLGEAAGRKVAVEAAGGEAYIRRTSDLSFDSLEDMARYIEANYSGDRHYQDAVEAANEIYPGLQEAL